MGAWGYKLYDDDVTCDIRDSYIEKFQNDSNIKISIEDFVEENYGYIENDNEDTPLFWFALADTMWDCGRLTEVVKIEALHHIESGEDLKRWEEEGLDDPLYKKRKKELERLKLKLLKEQPKEKRLINRKKYENDWKDGDVYLLPLTDDYAQFAGVKDEFLIFIKVGEMITYPQRKIPVVIVKMTKNKKKPKTREDIELAEAIKIYQIQKKFKEEYIYRKGIDFTSKNSEKEMEYMGNFGDLNLPYHYPGYYDHECFFAKWIIGTCIFHYMENNRKHKDFPIEAMWCKNKGQYKNMKF